MMKLANAGKPWTVADVKQLEDEIKACMPATEIAKHLGRSEEAIYAKAHHEHMSMKGLGHPGHHAPKKW